MKLLKSLFDRIAYLIILLSYRRPRITLPQSETIFFLRIQHGPCTLIDIATDTGIRGPRLLWHIAEAKKQGLIRSHLKYVKGSGRVQQDHLSLTPEGMLYLRHKLDKGNYGTPA